MVLPPALLERRSHRFGWTHSGVPPAVRAAFRLGNACLAAFHVDTRDPRSGPREIGRFFSSSDPTLWYTAIAGDQEGSYPNQRPKGTSNTAGPPPRLCWGRLRFGPSLKSRTAPPRSGASSFAPFCRRAQAPCVMSPRLDAATRSTPYPLPCLSNHVCHFTDIEYPVWLVYVCFDAKTKTRPSGGPPPPQRHLKNPPLFQQSRRHSCQPHHLYPS